MKLSFRVGAAALLLLASSACATTGGESATRGMDSITAEEIESAGSYSNAYELVQRTRPQWLRKRGRSNIGFEGAVKVYVDGSRFGDAESLAQVIASNVAEMKYLRSAKASDRFGMNHDQGAILVTLK